MLHSDLSCDTRPEYAPAAIQRIVDRFLRYPKSQVSQLEWSLRFVVGNRATDRIRDAVLAFCELGSDGYPLADRYVAPPKEERLAEFAKCSGFPSFEELLADFATGMREHTARSVTL